MAGAAEEHLALQKPAAAPAAQPSAAAVHGTADVPGVHAGPVVHAALAGPGVHTGPGVQIGPGVHAGSGVQAEYDAERPAAAAAVLAGSREAPAAMVFAAGAKGDGACEAGQGRAWGGNGFHRWEQWSCDTSLFHQEGSC